MWRGDKGALLCEKVERLPAHGARLIRDDVIDDGHPGARKLDGAHMYGVAYEDHGIRAAAHSEEGGPGRMAGMYRRSNARQDFLAVIEGLQPPSIQIGPKRRLCFAQVALRIASPFRPTSAEHEIHVRLADLKAG